MPPVSKNNENRIKTSECFMYRLGYHTTVRCCVQQSSATKQVIYTITRHHYKGF